MTDSKVLGWIDIPYRSASIQIIFTKAYIKYDGAPYTDFQRMEQTMFRWINTCTRFGMVVVLVVVASGCSVKGDVSEDAPPSNVVSMPIVTAVQEADSEPTSPIPEPPTGADELTAAIADAQQDFDIAIDAYNAALNLSAVSSRVLRPKMLHAEWIQLEVMRVKTMLHANNTDYSLPEVNNYLHDYAATLRKAAIEAGVLS